MTRKPKIIAPSEGTPEAEELTEEQKAEAERIAAEEAEQQKLARAEMDAEFFKRLKKAANFDGDGVKVRCTLKGYESVTVFYNTENRYELGLLFAITPPSLDLIDRARLWALFIRRIEWDFKDGEGTPIPTPTPSDPDTFMPLFYQFSSLGRWLRNEGYEEAKAATFPLSSSRSKKT